MVRSCKICRASALKEIDQLLLDGRQYRDIALKVEKEFPGVSLHALEQSIGRHHKSKHTATLSKGKDNMVALKEAYDLATSGQVSWDQFKEKVRQIGYQNILTNPESVGPREVIALESIESQKNKSEGRLAAMEKSWSAFFGGFLKPHICPKCGDLMLPRPQDYTDDEEIQQIMATTPSITYEQLEAEQEEFQRKKESGLFKDLEEHYSIEEWKKRLYFYLQGTSQGIERITQKTKPGNQEQNSTLP